MADEIPNGDPSDGDPKVKVKKAPVAKIKAAIAAPLQDTLVTPKGNIITKQQFLDSAKQGLPFTDMKTMGDWVDNWAKKPDTPMQLPGAAPVQVQPDYYQGYTTPGSGGMRYHQ